MENKIYWLAWHMVLAGQAQKFWQIINHFGSAKEAWLAPESEFSAGRGSGQGRAGDMLMRRRETDLELVSSYLDDKEISILFFTDEGYPEQLKNIYDPPPILFMRGAGDCFTSPAVALVGSRRASPYGLAVAEKLAHQLAGAGVNVISGMARGIDTAAHRGALDAGGKTCAVLGCGVDVVYPKENVKVMNSIIKTGAVISEFPPGSPPESWHFPVRNRIISGLARIVVVVEADQRSGALITAHVALEQGRDVMAVPGNITSKLSKGPNSLIRQGAAPVLEVADILAELGMEKGLFPEPAGEAGPGLKLTVHERLLHKLINFEPVSPELLAQRSGLSAGDVLTALMFLEMKGLIRQLPGRLYARAK